MLCFICYFISHLYCKMRQKNDIFFVEQEKKTFFSQLCRILAIKTLVVVLAIIIINNKSFGLPLQPLPLCVEPHMAIIMANIFFIVVLSNLLPFFPPQNDCYVLQMIIISSSYHNMNNVHHIVNLSYTQNTSHLTPLHHHTTFSTTSFTPLKTNPTFPPHQTIQQQP